MKTLKTKFYKLMSLVLATSIIFSNVSTSYATTKKDVLRTETIYVGLNLDGSFNKAIAYIDTILNGNTQVVDKGKYSENKIENLTNKVKPIVQADGSIQWNLSNDKKLEAFAYNAELDSSTQKNIPWTFDVNYYLNGAPVDPNKVAHSKGIVKIQIDVNANKNADSFYLNNYMLELTADFNMDDFISVNCEDAIEIVKGKTKTIMLIVLPGETTTYNIELGTNDFQYDGITLAMVPITGNVSEQIVDLVERKAKIEDAYDSSMKSADIVLSSLGEMTSGLEKITEGTKGLKEGMISMHSLQGKRDMSINELKEEVNGLEASMDEMIKHVDDSYDKVDELFETLTKINEIAVKLEKIVGFLKEDVKDLSEESEVIEDTLYNSERLLASLKKTIDDSDKLLALIKQSPIDTYTMTLLLTDVGLDFKELSAITSTDMSLIQQTQEYQQYTAIAQAAQTQLPGLVQQKNAAFTSLQSDLKDISSNMERVRKNIDTLEENAPILTDTLDDSEALLGYIKDAISVLTKYTDSVLNYKKDIDDLLDDTKKLLENISKLSKISSNSLDTLKEALDIASTKLYDSAVIASDGLIDAMKEFSNITKNANTFLASKNSIDAVIRDKWDKLDNESTIFEMDPNAKVISFTSSENAEPEKVQIFAKLPEIKDIVDDDLVNLEVQKDSGTFWNRIIDLFKNIWAWIIGIFKK